MLTVITVHEALSMCIFGTVGVGGESARTVDVRLRRKRLVVRSVLACNQIVGG